MQLSALNEECLVCVGHQPTPIASLPFVHTARRCYRWHLDRATGRPVRGFPGRPPPSVPPGRGVWAVPAPLLKLCNVLLLEEAKVVTRLL